MFLSEHKKASKALLCQHARKRRKRMLELKKGIDILARIGGIETLDQAKALFEARCDS